MKPNSEMNQTDSNKIESLLKLLSKIKMVSEIKIFLMHFKNCEGRNSNQYLFCLHVFMDIQNNYDRHFFTQKKKDIRKSKEALFIA